MGMAWAWLCLAMRRPRVRGLAIAAGVCASIVIIALAGLSWRLARGPISLDLATPWLVEAIEGKLGGQQRVEVGGTQIERSDSGQTSVRLLDVVLRDRDGSVVASAPKVEVGLSGPGLLAGQIRAERISLVGAEVSVRIDHEGQVTVFAGGNKRPITVAPPAPVAGRTADAIPPTSAAKPDTEAAASTLLRSGADGFAAMLAWIDGLSRVGLDGHELSEIGLKNGTLVVEDQRENARWTFDNIDMSLTRPHRGGVQFSMQSGQSDRHWSIHASATPTRGDRRSIRLEASRVPAKDLLLALRFADLPVKADLPLSIQLRAEIGATGAPDLLQGTIVAGPGRIGGSSGDETLPVEHAAINFDWNAARRALLMPLQVVMAGHRLTLFGQVEAPLQQDDPWRLHLSGGSIVLGADTRAPLVFNRVQFNARLYPAKWQLRVDGGEIGNADTGIALSGGLDYSGPPRLTLGLAARPMSLATMMRLWPSFVSPEVRAWVAERVARASVERVDVAINAPLEVLAPAGPPIPDDALSVTVAAKGAVLRPVDSLPEIHEADLDVRATGRTATVRLGQGTVALRSGRRLTMSEGTFHVPDTSMDLPMSRTRFRMEGPLPAAAELLAMDRLRAASSGSPLDPVTSRGNVNAQVTLDIPLLKDLSNATVDYSLGVDFTNFSAERMIMGQRVEAAHLRLSADNSGYSVKGDVKIGGTPASLEYRTQKGQAEDEVRLQAVLDDATRDRLGLDLGPALTGAVPIKLAGRIAANGKDGRFAVEADLTQAKIDELLPGLVKPPAKPARATFTLTTRPATNRLDDIMFDGSGAIIRGNVVVDAAGLVSANFPVYSLSSGDKVSLKAERDRGGVLHATLRGDVLDGRPFMQAIMAGRPAEANGEKPKSTDLEFEARIGAIAGHYGEALRSLEMKLSRRNGHIRAFTLKARLGRDATLTGDLRPRRNGRQVLYIEADDAGALFRFTNTYSRLVGGRMSVAMDPPSSDPGPQRGVLDIYDFAVRGEAALDRIVAGAGPGQRSGVEFASMHVDFTRSPGQLSIRDGVVRGPLIGGTIDGAIDYRRDDVRMRGTLVPLFGLNNMFGRLPIVGLVLGGGSNEGLVGITYEVAGPLEAPVMRVNPISAVAPGFIRKFFEFPNANAPIRSPAETTR